MIVTMNPSEASNKRYDDPERRTPAENGSEKKEEGKKGLTKEQKERIARNKEAAMERKKGVEMKMHPIHQQLCKDEKEHKYTRGYKGS